jgi:hypothetical protein
MIDLITDGVAPAALKINGGKAVYAALVTTAASAYLRGWDRTEWEALVQEPRRTLGRQVALKDGHRQRSPKAINKALRDAWDAATVWLSKQGPAP